MANSTKLADLVRYLSVRAPMILDSFERLLAADSPYFAGETERMAWASSAEGTEMIRAMEKAAEALGLCLTRIYAAAEPEPLVFNPRVRPSSLADSLSRAEPLP